MEWLAQKRGEVGLVDTGAEFDLGGLDVLQRVGEMEPQLIDVVGAAIGQGVLGLGPDTLVRIEFRSVRWKRFEMQTAMASAEGANGIAFVDAAVVPDHNDLAAKVPEQVTKELTDFRLRDVLGMKPEVQTQPLAVGAYGHGGDDGNPMAQLMMAKNRGLTARSPSFPHGRDQQEPRFVNEDKVGTQPRSVFFIRGHWRRFHCSMASSSRSDARFSGFWYVQSKEAISRPT